MRNRRSIDAFALAVSVIAPAIAWLSLTDFSPRKDMAIYREVGRTLAVEASKALGNEGKVIVIARDTSTYRQPAMEISVQELEESLEHLGVSVTHRLIQLDPLRPVEVPPGDFYEAIRRGKSNDVIVSFLGPPILEPEQQTKVKGAKPKMVALCTGTMAEQADLADLSARGLLRAAIVNRTSERKMDATLSFDELYVVVREGGFPKLMTGR